MPKFFVSPNDVRGSFLTLDGENAAHAKVLRLRRGDSVLVCDGCGTDCHCTVSDISPQQVCLVVNSTEASGAEPLVACSVYMAYAKADKLEHVIQKATELGAYEIAAFPSSRCVLKLDAASAEKRRERWQKIAVAGAIIGGTSMTGGCGSIFGTLLGVFVMSMLKSGLPYIGLQANWQQIITGLILILAVFIDVIKNRKLA